MREGKSHTYRVLKEVLTIRSGHFDGSVARSRPGLVSPLDGYDECKVAIMANLASGWTITDKIRFL